LQAANVKHEADRANAERDFLVSVFEAAGADLPRDRRPGIDDIVDQATSRLTAQNGLPPALRADLLLTLAKVALSVGAPDRAIALLDRAQPAIQREDGADDTDAWSARVIRASALVARSERTEAIALLEPWRAKLLARRDRIGIDGTLTLGNALLHQGRIDDGLRLLHQAVVIAGSASAPRPDALLAASIDEITGLMDAQRFEEGLDRANAVLALWHQLGEPPSQRIIDLFGNTAAAAEATGDIPRAESAYREAIALSDRFFDRPSPASAWNTGMYGSFLIAQGRLDEAEPYARKGLELSRVAFGDADPHTLTAVARMCKLQLAREDFRGAADWCTQGVDACRTQAIDDVVCPRLLAIRGRARALLRPGAEADRDLGEALARQRARGGESTPSYAYILDNLAVAQIASSRYPQALRTTDQALSIYRSANGGMLQAQLATRFSRAQALFGLERNDEALREVLDVEPSYTALFPDGALRFDMLALKARALARARRMPDAGEAARQALALKRKRKNADPAVLDELDRLAQPRTG